MPPRGSRGAGARGRGRGRGRGAARAGHSAADTRASVQDAQSDSTIEASSQANDSSSNNDVIMSNAPAQTTPIEVLSGSDSQSEQSGSTSSRQSRTTSATPSRAGGRFRPKNIRRDAAERAKLEAERNRDLAAKIKEEERELRAEERRSRRGRGRGRGRGDSSRGGFVRRTVTASGPFSAISQNNVKAEGGRGFSGFKSGSEPQFKSVRYRSRRENEERVNIDLLNGITEYDEEGKVLPANYTRKSPDSLPIGLLRTEHEEEEVKVKTTAELEAEEQQSSDDEELFISHSPDAGIDDDQEVWHVAPAGPVTVKTEPGMEPEEMDVDMADIPEAIQPKAPPSPELQKKPITTEEAAAARQRKRKEKAAKDPELMQAMYDLEAQLGVLSFKPSTGAENEGDKDGDKENDGEEEAPRLHSNDDQMMLFQLPPILPPLVRLDGDTKEDAGATNPTSRENSSAPGSKIKTEDGAEKEKAWNPFSDLPPEGGLIGKLIVRKSGKVEFDWGGTMLSVGVGAETEFLTSAIMIEQNIDLQNPEASTGVACGMGEVKEKFVLAPIWDEEEDWDPSLDGIDGLE
ncbi:hypothetical protein M426DRAFT_27314 [Hypoxylon sp. CI-4A]|nr:hypothetical protein M426DRAFT_27314 [Hypoxylon sp. CI-4A]